MFDIQQDNSCQINLDENKSIQKPKQVVGFNTKGQLYKNQTHSQKPMKQMKQQGVAVHSNGQSQYQ